MEPIREQDWRRSTEEKGNVSLLFQLKHTQSAWKKRKGKKDSSGYVLKRWPRLSTTHLYHFFFSPFWLIVCGHITTTRQTSWRPSFYSAFHVVISFAFPLFFSVPPSIPATRHTRLEAMLLLPHVLLWLVSFSLFVLLYSTFCFLFLSIISDVDWLFLAGQRRRQLSIGARAHTKAADGLRRGSPFIMTGGHQIAFSFCFGSTRPRLGPAASPTESPQYLCSFLYFFYDSFVVVVAACLVSIVCSLQEPSHQERPS